MNITKSEDSKLLADLNKDVQDLHYQMYPEKYKPYDYKKFVKFYDQLLRNDKVECFVCYLADSPIGYFVVEERTYPDSPFSIEMKSIYIQQIFVNERIRLQGVGKEIMEYIKNIARQKGVSRIELDVKYKNESAEKFFTKMNFVPFNRLLELVLE